MPKTSKPVPKKLRILGWMNAHQIISLLIAALIIAGAWLLIGYIRNQQTIRHERAQFMQAKADLNEIYGDIVADNGQPASHYESQYCEYANLEFARGFRNCTVSQVILYKTMSLGEATKKAEMIDAKLRASKQNVTDTVQSRQSQDSNDILTTSFEKASLKCKMRYHYVDLSSIGDGNQGLRIVAYCMGNAKAEYFPLNNNPANKLDDTL